MTTNDAENATTDQLKCPMIDSLLQEIVFIRFDQQTTGAFQWTNSELQQMEQAQITARNRIELVELSVRRHIESIENDLTRTLAELESINQLINWPVSSAYLWSPLSDRVLVRVMIDRSQLRFHFKRDDRQLRMCNTIIELCDAIERLQSNQRQLRQLLDQLHALRARVQQQMHVVQINLVNLHNFRARRRARKLKQMSTPHPSHIFRGI